MAEMERCPKCGAITDYFEGNGENRKLICSKSEKGCGYEGKAKAAIILFSLADTNKDIDKRVKKALRRK